jgi:dTDP-glucose 4,6-dehydratase
LTAFRRALVTGGAGFLGSHLCDELVRRGTDVVCVDNYVTGNAHNVAHLTVDRGFRVIAGDVTEYVHVPGAVDLVLHLASTSRPNRVRDSFSPRRAKSTAIHRSIRSVRATGET